jgi:hypothetical protein
VGVERGIGAGLDEVDVLLDLVNQRQEYMVHIHNAGIIVALTRE